MSADEKHCWNCKIVLNKFMIVFSDKEIYCRICGNCFVCEGWYDDDIDDCYECKSKIDKTDELFNCRFDEHNNNYCKTCYCKKYGDDN